MIRNDSILAKRQRSRPSAGCQKQFVEGIDLPLIIEHTLALDKLGKVGHVEENTGAPILRRAFAYVECKVRQICEPGDHALVVGEVTHAGVRGQGKPIMCADLKWHYGG
ncbi:MAG: flavin reductase [Verrucomicrobia subdivision 3 bacterium]|nr:flavin reductase [Limisphaerales bacterium]